jgi:hypothetical protein
MTHPRNNVESTSHTRRTSKATRLTWLISPSRLYHPGRPNIFMVILLLLLLTPFTAIPLHAAPPESFILFYSNNIQGEIEPCG